MSVPEPRAPRVRIVHETDPHKYFPAIFALADAGQIELVGAHRYSVLKEFVRVSLRTRSPLRTRLDQSVSDLRFRLRIPFLKDEVIVLGFGPWDWRVLLYSQLLRRNRVVYHTSRPKWALRTTPHRYGPLTRLFRHAWVRFLRHPNTSVVAILPDTARELAQRFGVAATVIPHAVPEEFFAAREDRTQRAGLRLVYVGELSEKKGVADLLEGALRWEGARLTIVGDGPLRDRCEAAARAGTIELVGATWDREELARTVAAHDVLILLSKREGVWEELFGIVLAEAMAAGLGVIATDHIGPRAVVGELGLGNLFREGDTGGIDALIARLVEDPQALAQFKSEHGQAAMRYRLHHVAEAWSSVLDAGGGGQAG